MKLRTEISPKISNHQINYKDFVFSIGSCFSSEMGIRLKALQYSILTNPFGITFNAASICNTIMRIKNDISLPENEMIYNGSQWCHLDFHGSFNHPDKQIALQGMIDNLLCAKVMLPEIKHVIVTLGTAHVYVHKKSGHIVNNCHKLPAAEFDKKMMSVDDIVQNLNDMILAIQSMSDNDVQFVFAVSPIRHVKDGLHENQLSKATCLLAINQVCKMFDSAVYFPSYEIMMDDLRDYRFYKEDLIHPSELAVNHIFDLFENSLLSPEEKSIRNQVQKINQALSHRPIHPDTASHLAFKQNVEKEISEMERKYEFIKFNIR